MNDATPQPPSEIRRFIGLVLMVIGVLWMAATGLCTTIFGVSLLAEGSSDLAEASSIILLMLVYGGLSALAGFGVFAIGRWLRPRGPK